MPIPLGNFVSQTMYRRMLKSARSIKAHGAGCVKFVDILDGVEEHVSASWKVRIDQSAQSESSRQLACPSFCAS